MEQHKVGCVLMASGNASRFGRNKLAEELGGKPLFCHALDAIAPQDFEKVVVVSQYPQIAEYVKGHHYTYIHNDSPQKGVSHTIRLGISAMDDGIDGILFCVSDQPLLQEETVRSLLALWRKDPSKIAAPACNGVRGNPCLFPARFFPELTALSGDRGGSAVISRHREDLLLLEVDPRELMDADTPEALEKIRALI